MNYPPPYGAGPSPWDYERTRQVDRTRLGILLLLIGTLIGWIPVILYIGGLLVFIGAILVIMGRRAFGPTHSRNVVLAIALFFVGLVVGVVVGVVFALSTFAQLPAGSSTAVQDAALAAAVVQAALVSAVVSAFITGLASVFFTYALQLQTGKLLLWCAYGARIALSVAVYLIINPMLTQFVNQVITTGTYDPTSLVALQNQANVLQYLGVIPALLYTGANYLAWSRIKKGEIPETPSGAAPSPYGAPPYLPPQVPPPAMPPTPPMAPP